MTSKMDMSFLQARDDVYGSRINVVEIWDDGDKKGGGSGQ